jgi:NAD(P)-dependent dehydrogenase (short-subunit alcohol dehydrogenase family)
MSSPRLEGKVAIVTGAGASVSEGVGNGRAAAILMAREGARVLAVDLSAEAAQTTVSLVEDEGGTAAAFVADVRESSACAASVAEAMRRWGRLDVLDNNVGIVGPRGTVVTVGEDEWDHVMRVNVTSMVLASRHAIPAMVASGGGAIVNIGSVGGLRPQRDTAAYSTSKGAVVALTQAMAVAHGPDGVRVNCVIPGAVYTPLVYASGMPDDVRARRRAASLLDVEGTGWDVGHAVVYLASDEARFVTGAVLPVDGGLLLSPPGLR